MKIPREAFALFLLLLLFSGCLGPDTQSGAVCGNGVKEPGELCELNSDCQYNEICQDCRCVPNEFFP